MRTVGERIKSARKEKHITQKELSQQIGKSLRMLQKYEDGEVIPSIEQIKKIAATLEVPASQLMDMDRIVFDVRKDTPLSKDFIQRLLVASEFNGLTELILTALGEYAINHLGLDWYNENKTKTADREESPLEKELVSALGFDTITEWKEAWIKNIDPATLEEMKNFDFEKAESRYTELLALIEAETDKNILEKLKIEADNLDRQISNFFVYHNTVSGNLSKFMEKPEIVKITNLMFQASEEELEKAGKIMETLFEKADTNE